MTDEDIGPMVKSSFFCRRRGHFVKTGHAAKGAMSGKPTAAGMIIQVLPSDTMSTMTSKRPKTA